jgi:hypothetical protein
MGEAFVVFNNDAEAQEALKKNREPMGKRWISVMLSTKVCVRVWRGGGGAGGSCALLPMCLSAVSLPRVPAALTSPTPVQPHPPPSPPFPLPPPSLAYHRPAQAELVCTCGFQPEPRPDAGFRGVLLLLGLPFEWDPDHIQRFLAGCVARRTSWGVMDGEVQVLGTASACARPRVPSYRLPPPPTPSLVGFDWRPRATLCSSSP